jgi:hypothetical protein
VATADPVAELRSRAGKAPLTVVLSNHFVRYALLAPSRALASREEWLALARHTFETTYGRAAASWELRVSPGDRGKARIATGVDATLVEALRAIPQIVSVQPYLMVAFNRERKALREPAWLVLHEPGRLTAALVDAGEWKLVRSRQSRQPLAEALPGFLEREGASLGEEISERVLLQSEEAAPERCGRFRVTDVTLRARLRGARSQAMVLH